MYVKSSRYSWRATFNKCPVSWNTAFTFLPSFLPSVRPSFLPSPRIFFYPDNIFLILLTIFLILIIFFCCVSQFWRGNLYKYLQMFIHSLGAPWSASLEPSVEGSKWLFLLRSFCNSSRTGKFNFVGGDDACGASKVGITGLVTGANWYIGTGEVTAICVDMPGRLNVLRVSQDPLDLFEPPSGNQTRQIRSPH